MLLLMLLLLLLLMPTGRLSEPAAATNNARLLPGRAGQEGHSPGVLSGLFSDLVSFLSLVSFTSLSLCSFCSSSSLSPRFPPVSCCLTSPVSAALLLSRRQRCLQYPKCYELEK